MSNLKKNFSYLFLGQIFNQFLPLAIIPYLTRVLGVDFYGAYAYIILCIGFISVLLDYGFNIYGVQRVVLARSSDKKMAFIFSGINSAKFLILFFAIFLYFILIFCNENYEKIAFDMSFGFFALVGIAFQNFWLFSGLEKNYIFVVSMLFSRLLFLVLVFLFINGDEDFLLLIMFYGISQVLIAVISQIFVFKYVKKYFFSLKAAIYFIKRSYPFFISRLAVSIYTTGAGIFLGFFNSANNVALYAVADQIYRGIQSLISPLQQVMYPYMIRTKNFIFLYKVTCMLTLFYLAALPFCLWLSPYILVLLFGPDYLGSVDILNVFFIALLVLLPSIMLGYPLFGARGALNTVNKTVIFAAIFQVILFFALALKGMVSPMAIAFSIFLTESLVFLLRLKFGVIDYSVFSFKKGG